MMKRSLIKKYIQMHVWNMSEIKYLKEQQLYLIQQLIVDDNVNLNQYVIDYKLQQTLLPKNLKYLVFSDPFNQPMTQGILP